MSPDENSYSFLLWPKMMTATSTEHSTESSCAFLNRPPLRFRNVLAWSAWARGYYDYTTTRLHDYTARAGRLDM